MPGPVQNENVGTFKTAKRKHFPLFYGFFWCVVVFIICCLMSCSLGFRDTHRASADTPRHQGAPPHDSMKPTNCWILSSFQTWSPNLRQSSTLSSPHSIATSCLEVLSSWTWVDERFVPAKSPLNSPWHTWPRTETIATILHPRYCRN